MFFNSFINWKAKKKFLILKEKIQKFNQINEIAKEVSSEFFDDILVNFNLKPESSEKKIINSLLKSIHNASDENRKFCICPSCNYFVLRGVYSVSKQNRLFKSFNYVLLSKIIKKGILQSFFLFKLKFHPKCLIISLEKFINQVEKKKFYYDNILCISEDQEQYYYLFAISFGKCDSAYKDGKYWIIIHKMNEIKRFYSLDELLIEYHPRVLFYKKLKILNLHNKGKNLFQSLNNQEDILLSSSWINNDLYKKSYQKFICPFIKNSKEIEDEKRKIITIYYNLTIFILWSSNQLKLTAKNFKSDSYIVNDIIMHLLQATEEINFNFTPSNHFIQEVQKNWKNTFSSFMFKFLAFFHDYLSENCKCFACSHFKLKSEPMIKDTIIFPTNTNFDKISTILETPDILCIKILTTKNKNLKELTLKNLFKDNTFITRIEKNEKIIEYKLKALIFKNEDKEIILKYFHKDNEWNIIENERKIDVQVNPFEGYEDFYLSHMFLYKEQYDYLLPIIKCLNWNPLLSSKLKEWHVQNSWANILKKIVSFKIGSINQDSLHDFNEFIALNIYKTKNYQEKLNIIELFEMIHNESKCLNNCPICKCFSLKSNFSSVDIFESWWKVSLVLSLPIESNTHRILSNELNNIHNIMKSNDNVSSLLLYHIIIENSRNDINNIQDINDDLLEFLQNNNPIECTNPYNKTHFYYINTIIIENNKGYSFKFNCSKYNNLDNFLFDEECIKPHVNILNTTSNCKLILIYECSDKNIELFLQSFFKILLRIGFFEIMETLKIELSWINYIQNDYRQRREWNIEDSVKVYMKYAQLNGLEFTITKWLMQFFNELHSKLICANDSECIICEYFSFSMKNNEKAPNCEDDKSIYMNLTYLYEDDNKSKKKTLYFEKVPRYFIVYVDEYDEKTENFQDFLKKNNRIDYQINETCDKLELISLIICPNSDNINFKVLLLSEFHDLINYAPHLLIYYNNSHTSPIAMKNNLEDNLCYIISSIQSVYNIKSFRNDIIRWDCDKNWVNELKEILKTENNKKIKYKPFHLQQFRKYYSEDTEFFEHGNITDQKTNEKFIESLCNNIHKYCKPFALCPFCKNFIITGVIISNKGMHQNIRPNTSSVWQNISSNPIKLHDNILAVRNNQDIAYLIDEPPMILWIRLIHTLRDKDKHKYLEEIQYTKDYIIKNSTISYSNEWIIHEYILKSIILYGNKHYKTLLYSKTRASWTLMNDAKKEETYKKIEDYEMKNDDFIPKNLFYQKKNVYLDPKLMRYYINHAALIFSRLKIFNVSLSNFNCEFSRLLQSIINNPISHGISNLLKYFPSINELNSLTKFTDLKILTEFHNFFEYLLKLIHKNLKKNNHFSRSCNCPSCVTFGNRKISKDKNYLFRCNLKILDENKIISLPEKIKKNPLIFGLLLQYNKKIDGFGITEFIRNYENIWLSNNESYEMKSFLCFSKNTCCLYEESQHENSYYGNKIKKKYEFISVNGYNNTISFEKVEGIFVFYTSLEQIYKIEFLLRLIKLLFRNDNEINEWEPKNKFFTGIKKLFLGKSLIFDPKKIISYYEEEFTKTKSQLDIKKIEDLFVFTIEMLHTCPSENLSCFICKNLSINGRYYRHDSKERKLEKIILKTYIDSEFSQKFSKNILFFEFHSNSFYGVPCMIENPPYTLIYSLKLIGDSYNSNKVLKFINKNKEINYENQGLLQNTNWIMHY